MCVVSMVMDDYYDRWGNRRPWGPSSPGTVPYVPIPGIDYPTQTQTPPAITITSLPQITSLEVEEFRKLLERAREYDKKHNEPDCELSEKKEKLLALAKELGVEINFL
jgi:hypothetical protein